MKAFAQEQTLSEILSLLQNLSRFSLVNQGPRFVTFLKRRSIDSFVLLEALSDMRKGCDGKASHGTASPRYG